ncbi:TPA: hypothetical protein HA234_02925 [Candidatus Woesearchaeota archaeon]|nr:hypothetical protein [Candidatus Woesearchaeota archaeon]
MRSKKDLFFYDEFRQLQQKYPQLVYLPTLSREQWEGKSGRVQTHLPTDLTGKTFYICGIKEVVLETKEYLLSRGVAPENIKGERYN